jgi:hypothetical protein
MITSKILPILSFTVISCVIVYFNFCRISGTSISTNLYLLSVATKSLVIQQFIHLSIVEMSFKIYMYTVFIITNIQNIV